MKDTTRRTVIATLLALPLPIPVLSQKCDGS